jgi:predicted acetyltransferase
MTIEVRKVKADELAGWSDAKDIGFNSAARRGEDPFWYQETDLDRTWGAFAGDKVVGTLRGAALELTVPGATVRIDGLTNVTVLATHRRRGLLTRMMNAELAAAHERGEALSGLHAAAWPIYGRFGFGPAADLATTHVDTRAARFRDDATGSVEQVTPELARAEAAALYERVRTLTSGAVSRDGDWWDHSLGLVRPEGKPAPLDTLDALGRDAAGTVTGYVRYKVASDAWQHERPDNKLEVLDLFGVDVAAEARLWRYLCDHDWVTGVSAGQRRVDEPWRFLLRDPRTVWQSDRWDGEWVRVLDVPAALTARRYEVPGRLALRVTDKDGFAEGTFALDGGPDGATCVPTTANPDVTLPVATLSALYLGGFGARRAALLGWLSEETTGAVARMEVMFRTAIAPWSITLY